MDVEGAAGMRGAASKVVTACLVTACLVTGGLVAEAHGGGQHPAAKAKQGAAGSTGFPNQTYLAVANSEPSLTVAIAADHGSNTRAREVLRRIGADQPAALFSLGDFSYDTVSPSAWCQLVKDQLNAGAGKPARDPYGETLPVEVVGGNHDTATLSQYLAPSCLPNRLVGMHERVSGSYGRDYYVDLASPTTQAGQTPLARIIMASPGLGTSYAPGSAAATWLAQAVDSARAAGTKWVIVGNHFNTISSGTKSNEAGSDFFTLVVNKKVDLLLQGHDHTYQRSKQLATSATCPTVPTGRFLAACVTGDGAQGSYIAGKGTVLVINGLGGAETYAINPADAQAGYFARTVGRTTGELAGSSRLTITPSSLSMRFVGTPATTFTDSFTISASPTPPSPEVYTDTFSGVDAAAWPSAWSSQANSGAVDVRSGRGRLAFTDVAGAYARARLEAGDPLSDAQVSFSYGWSSSWAAAYASVYLRGSGGWQNAYRPWNGYGVQVANDSSTVQVQRTVGGVMTPLVSLTGAQPVGTGRMRVRFGAQATTLRLKLWPEGSAEPSAWTWIGTDPAVSSPGRLHLSLARSSRNSGTKEFTLDDLTWAAP